jgi:WD40 repeat protein/tRNA A-37 threonylcarbamoyl transferase component Bud32
MHESDETMRRAKKAASPSAPSSPSPTKIPSSPHPPGSTNAPGSNAPRSNVAGPQLPRSNAPGANAPSSGSPNSAIDPDISLEPDSATSSRPISSGLVERLHAHTPAATRYVVENEIARGGMGAILRVWDEDLRRTLAMKVVLGRGKQVDDDGTPHVEEQVLARFLEEAQVTGQLDHPGVVPVHELGIDARGRVYFTMRLVKGRDLKDIIDLVHARKEGWTQTKAIGVILKVCEAMAYAHSKGVIHRDLKPANIMVGRFGETYVMDWGLAKVIGRKDRHDLRLKQAAEAMPSLVHVERKEMLPPDSNSPLVTMDGTIVGTPAYMPPEQAKGLVDEMTVRSDVYAVGAMLYHLLTGEIPYVARDDKLSPITVLRMVLDAPPKPVHEIDRNVAPELVAICERAMTRDPASRYADMLEMANDLQAYVEGRVVRAHATGAVAEFKKWVDRNRGMAAALAAALFLLVLGLVVSSSLYVKADTSATLARSEKERADAKAIEAEHNADRARASESEVRARGYVANLLAAAFSLFVDDVANCKRSLEACPAELRGWEWKHLALASDTSLSVIHAQKPITCVAFNADGSEIITGADGAAAHVWNERTGRRVAVVGNAGTDSGRFALSPDGTHIACGSIGDGRVRIRSRENGEVVAHGVLPDVSSLPECMAYRPDGKRLATAFADGTVRIWNTETNAWMNDLSGSIPGLAVPIKSFTSLAYSGDGTRVAAGAADGSILVWNAESGESLAVLRGHDQSVTSVAFLRDGAHLVSASNDRTIRIWDVEKKLALDVMRGHDAPVYCIAVKPDGSLIASGSADKTVRVWNAKSHHELAVLHGHEKPVKCVAFSPDGSRIVSGSNDMTARIWDADMAGAVAMLREPSVERAGVETQSASDVNAIAFSPDGSRIAAALEDGRIQIWDPEKHEELAVLRGHTASVNSIAFSRDGKRIVSASSDRTVRAWDATSYAVAAVMRDHQGQVLSVAFSPDGARIASAAEDKTIMIHDAASGALVNTLRGHAKSVTCVAFSPDGARIASGSSDHSARVWDAKSGESVGAPLEHTHAVTCVAFSPDGERIATCSDEILRVWKVGRDEAPSALLGHDLTLRSCAFSPDGARIVTSSLDNTLRLWDGRTGDALFALRGHDRRVTRALFSPDGSRVAAGASSQTILLWETEPVAAHFTERRETALAVQGAKPIVDAMFDELVASEDVVRKLQTDTSLDESRRATAIRLARFRGDDPALLTFECERIAVSPDKDAKEYARALRMAETAWLERPENTYYAGLLGLAQYRAGEYAKSIATIKRAEPRGHGEPRYIAVLAMAEQRAGQTEAASRTLARLREVMKKKRWAEDKDATAFAREAETLIGGGADASGKK